jgi:hypothetical protein
MPNPAHKVDRSCWLAAAKVRGCVINIQGFLSGLERLKQRLKAINPDERY